MKNIYGLAVVGMLMLVSCSKFLDERPQSIAVENFYNTPVEMESGLNAIYETVRYLSTFGGFYTLLHEINTEYMYGRGSFAPMNSYQGLDNTNVGRITDTWNNFYKGIRNANIIIQKAPLATGITDEERQRYIAEARFLRGLYYFHLVRNWAGVPLHTENNLDSINIQKSSPQVIYDLIQEDMVFAENNLPDNPRLVGTPSKWTAKTALAEVYLTLKKYDLARKAAWEVIQSKKYSLVSVSVADDFEKIFGRDANNTSEEIMYFKYSSKVSGQGYQYLAYLHATTTGNFPPGGFATIYSDSLNPFLKNWDRADLRYRFTWYASNINIVPSTVLCKKFSDKQATIQQGNNDYTLYRYADLLLFYAEAEASMNGAPTADAVEKLNMVRRRAYGKPANTPDPAIDIKITDYPGLDAFVRRVVLERGYETVGEGKHWFDLKRLGIWKETIKEIEGLDMAEKHMLWPIPPREFNGNTALNPTADQNPGY
jgi:starch-binding outer membrane protein, SusD/RagB family